MGGAMKWEVDFNGCLCLKIMVIMCESEQV